MRNYDEQFKGYEVPESIKNISIQIMTRFSISGVCDGMYICNVIATTCGIGDGCGKFTDDTITKQLEIAERLQSCYGCNIMKEDIKELENIIITGNIEKEIAIPRMNKYIKQLNNEKRICDPWRVDYLNRVIDTTKQSIGELII
jgi:hypothetical protein